MFASIIVNVKKVLCDGNGEEIFFAIDMTKSLAQSIKTILSTNNYDTYFDTNKKY